MNEASACVLCIADREHDYVTLVTLNTFNVLNKEACVLTVVFAVHFRTNNGAELGILDRFFIDDVIDHIALRYVESDNTNGFIVLSCCKELFNELYYAFSLFAVCTTLPYGVGNLVNLNRRFFGLIGVGSNKKSSFIESVVREVDELLVLGTVVCIEEYVGVTEASQVKQTFFLKCCRDFCILVEHIFHFKASIAKAGGAELLVVARNNDLLCTCNRGNTSLNIELRSLVKDNEIEQIVLLRQNLGYCFRCHQPNLECLEELEVKLLNEFCYAAASAALNRAADLALALGSGDIFDIISQKLCDALTREVLLDFDIILHGGDDLFKGIDLGDKGTVFALELLNVFKQNGIVELVVPFGYRATADLVDLAECCKIEVFVVGQAHYYRLKISIACGEFFQTLFNCFRLFHHQANGIGATCLLEVVFGQVLNVFAQAALGCLTLYKGLIPPFIHFQYHFIDGIGEENEIVVGKIILHLEEPRITFDGELIVVKAVG